MLDNVGRIIELNVERGFWEIRKIEACPFNFKLPGDCPGVNSNLI